MLHCRQGGERWIDVFQGVNKCIKSLFFLLQDAAFLVQPLATPHHKETMRKTLPGCALSL